MKNLSTTNRINDPSGEVKMANPLYRGYAGYRWGGRCVASLLAALACLSTLARDAAIRLEVDATDAPRRILHARLSIPAQPGPLTLVYPKWIPGDHGPTGPITDLAGLRLTAGGHPLEWRRDAEDMFAFHLDVPPSARSVEVALDSLLPSETGNPADEPSTSARVLDLSWHQVLLYPTGATAGEITFAAKLRLPSGWHYATALTTARESSAGIEFQPVSLETLVDSPVMAGVHFRAIPLGGSAKPRHWLDLVGDSAAALDLKPEDQAHFSRLVAEAEALFGARHYRDYHFLLTLSDHVAHFGLEHHESSDNRAGERFLTDEDAFKIEACLLPHEMVHSWNGKYRRPAGLATPDYQTPMRGELLWVYEGLTEYLGMILTARSGLWTNSAFLEYLGWQAAALEATAGRRWRPLADTTIAAQLLYLARSEGAAWRRGVDFYSEGSLIWLEADVRIRQQTQNRRSLDDFCRRFCGGQDTPPRVVPYTLDDVLADLEAVAPSDWRAFFQQRVYAVAPHAPLGGIQGGGWRLAYTNRMSDLLRSREATDKGTDLTWSLGLSLKDSGAIADVIPGSPADAAGLGPAMKLLAVDGRRWSVDGLRTAIQTAKTNSAPIELLVENGEFFKTAKIEYHGGEKYPTLERDPAKPDLLSRILAPLTPEAK